MYLQSESYAPNQKVKIVNGAENILNLYVSCAKSLRKSIDVCYDLNGPIRIRKIAHIWTSNFEIDNKEIKVRLLTDIRNENLEYCKKLLEEIEHIEIRHMDGVKGNFTILDSKELLITDFVDKLGEPVNDALFCTQKEMTEAHIFMFENLWRQAIPAHARFKELEKGIQPEILQTIKEPHEIVETEHKLLRSAKDEILIIFHASNALLREINSGGIDLIVKQAIKYKTQIRILVPIDDKITDTVQKLERLSVIQVRNIEQVIQTRVTILVVDRTYSLVIALKDDTKGSSEQEIGLAAYSNSKSTVLSYVSIFESLWKHSQLREELLINSMAQKEFINIAAHELRTPIQPILGLSEILSRKVGNETVEYVNVIIKNARRLHHLAEDILDITRIEAKSLKLNKQSFSFVKTIREVVQDYSSSTVFSKSSPDVIISFSASEDLQFLNIVADQNRIKQVISNLVNNSLKFTKQGTITVTVETDNYYGNNKQSQLIVRVKDTGIGIAEDIIPKLFSKFVTKSEKGTGLGLYICKGIIDAHGGKIWAENNKEGKGATFSFSLPA
ncbi:MAG TPA: HAMP domain-containing sensor histidine kinase [Nitrososphaeraceae archaeon]